MIMPDIQTTCCFTGHRAAKLPWKYNEADSRCIQLKTQIYDAVEAVYEAGIRHYICGMANGGDLYFGEAVLQLRKKHPEITLEAAIPYAGQAEHWSPALRTRWQTLSEESDYQTLVSQVYTPDCMHRRNQYMVDNSSVVIAAFNGSSGGTMNTLLYAIRSKREIIQIPVDAE